MNSKPPPLPPRTPLGLSSPRNKLLIVLCLIPAVIPMTLTVLRLCGLICPYSIPTASMVPAVSPGDHVIMEGVSYLFRQPKRGDIAVFKSDGIAQLSPYSRYIKRIVGVPGERVRLADGQLFINDKLTVLSNDFGAITYEAPSYPNEFSQLMPPMPQTNVTVPDASYFILGDNATNSFDSRFFGSIPRRNITGRIWFCYWPPQRVGFVK